jgi:hypothetical protein
VAGVGGAGQSTSISGSSVQYGGGGGGAADVSSSSPPNGAGGAGGGGAGGGNAEGNAGTVNTGGGGGAGLTAGAGGSGIVILRYPDAYIITIGAGLTGTWTLDENFDWQPPTPMPVEEGKSMRGLNRTECG